MVFTEPALPRGLSREATPTIAEDRSHRS